MNEKKITDRLKRSQLPVSITLGIGKDYRMITVTRKRGNKIIKIFAEKPTIGTIKEIWNEERFNENRNDR